MTEPDQITDAALVEAARAGDRNAFAAIYERYGDRIYTTCVHLLRDRDEGADCAGDVFLLAAERLHQLRDPSRVRPWLYAIARHEVYRRTRRRSREIPTDTMDDLTTPFIDDEIGPDPTELRELLDAAARGLDERDRVALALSLDGGLDGDELAAAIGTSTANAHVVMHRMRDRLATAVGALLVARGGRSECKELDRLLDGWDGHFTVLTRKRVARHAESCEVCDERRRRAPAAMLSIGPALAAPALVRDRVLGELRLVSHSGRPWSRSGFPPADPRRRFPTTASRVLAATLGLMVLLAAGAGFGVWAPWDGDEQVAVIAPTSAPTAIRSSAPSTTRTTTTTPTASTTNPTETTQLAVVPNTPLPPVTTTTRVTSTTVPIRGTVLTVTPGSIDLGIADTTRTISITNTGDRAGTLALTTSATWLTLTPTSLRLETGVTVAITVTSTRTGLPEGSAVATVTIAGGATTQSVAVTIGIANPPVISSVLAPTQFSIVSGCSVSAAVSDDTGIGEVVVEYSTPNGMIRTPPMTPRSGRYYASVNVGSPPRTVTWRVVATDTAGNTAVGADQTTPAGSFCQYPVG